MGLRDRERRTSLIGVPATWQARWLPLSRLLRRLRSRLHGLPRSAASLDASLRLLATFRHLGWQDSVERRLPVDANGHPLPWYTYPAICWLESVLTGDERVFEFGAGYSTLWYALRCKTVRAVEHERHWVEELLARSEAMAPSIEWCECKGDGAEAPVGDAYVDAIERFAPPLFDIIAVDGRARNACVERAIPFVAKDGVLLLDNSDRSIYSRSLSLLAAEGFGRIDFHGPVAGSPHFSCTSVFSRDFDRWLRTPAGARAPGA